jgi:hypothetical protein
VDDHAGCVDDAAQLRGPRRRQVCVEGRGQVARVVARLHLLTRARENLPGGLDRERVVAAARQHVHRRQIAQLHGPKASCYCLSSTTS